MRVRLTHYFRLMTIALAAVCAVAFNHRHVAVVRVVADTSSETPTVGAGRHRVVVRERVSLESTHADALTVAGPAVAWLPPTKPGHDSLGAWLTTLLGVAFGLAAFTVRPLPRRAVAAPAFARLLGASVAPQAP